MAIFVTLYNVVGEKRIVERRSSTTELWASPDAVSTPIYLQNLVMELSYHREATITVNYPALAKLATYIKEPAEDVYKIYLYFIIRKNFKPETVSAI